MSSVINELALPEPWQDLRAGVPGEADQRATLRTELARELSPGHALYGQDVTVVGRSDRRDDILVALARGGWAIVHLTWKQGPDTPPWPITDFYDDAESLGDALQATNFE